MKQTVELESGRKATVDIPFNKLSYNASNYQRNTQEAGGCDSKVVLVNCGGGCKSTKRTDNTQIKAIIAELETAYDGDVKKLEDKVGKLEKENADLRAAHALELQQQKHDYLLQLEKANSAVQLLKLQCKRKDKEIADLLNEKEIIMRNKINQFRQNQYIDKIRQLQDVIRLKDIQIADLTGKMQSSHRERVKVEEERAADQNRWEADAKKIKLEFAQFQTKCAKERSDRDLSHKEKEIAFEKHVSALQHELNLEREKSQLISVDLDQKYKSEQEKTKILQDDIDSKAKDILMLKSNLIDSQNRYSSLKAEIVDSDSKLTELKDQSLVLMNKLQNNEEALIIIDRQKGDLLLQINAKMTEIQNLKRQLAGKEKVVEVKIQRVVEGKPEIQRLRSIVAQLQIQLKQFGDEKIFYTEEIKKRQNLNIQLKENTLQLKAQISELKLFIEKRQGSFKWAVQRQIERDLAVNQVNSQVYKVSQIRQYSRERSPQKNVMEEASSGIKAHILGNVSDQIILDSFANPPPQ